MNDEDLDKAIEDSRLKEIQPNYELADLIREKVRRMGWGIKDTPTGPIPYKL